jgi:Nif-specific regulatory protein
MNNLVLETPSIELPPRYRLIEILKETESTAVYHVWDAVDDREEALKILRSELSGTQQILQFRSEVSTLAGINHPNVVRIYDFSLLHERFPSFSMEFVRGRRISEVFDGSNWSELLGVVFQVALGLQHIHHHGIIHFDIKPSNLLVDDGRRLKITDFGVAAQASTLFERKIRGTFHYMAPEVLRQEEVDPRADLFSLGMTLYETVTGTLPTWGLSNPEVLLARLDGRIRPPSELNPNVPAKIESMILRLLEYDPRKRYPSAGALIHELSAATGIEEPAAGLLSAEGELHAAPLIGREEEIGEILAAVDRAREAEGGGIILAGPGGMGKSRILEDVMLRAQLEGARVFRGRCQANRKTLYAPFFSIFQKMLRGVNPDANAVDELRSMMRPILKGTQRGGERGRKYRFFNRIVQSIQDVYGFLNVTGAGAFPLVLMVEDLQWADASTIDLFTFLVGEAKGSKLLVVGTLTTEEDESAERSRPPAEAPLPERWVRRSRESSIRIVRIDGLDEGRVRDYVGSILGTQNLPDELVHWVYWETSGSPLQIRRVLEYLIRHNYLSWSSEGWWADLERIQTLRLAGGAAAFWSEQVDALDEEARQVLQMASVLGDQFDLDSLAAITEMPDEKVYEHLLRLSAGTLLSEDQEEEGFRFPQVNLRDAVYASLSETTRTRAHRLVGEHLERTLLDGNSGELGLVAFHYSRSDDIDKGIEYCVRAGEMASATLVHEQAAEFYRLALELMDLAGREGDRLDIRERLGDAYAAANDLQRAMQVYQFVLKSLRARGDESSATDRSLSLMLRIAEIHAKRSEHDSAISYLRQIAETYRVHERKVDQAGVLDRIATVQHEAGDLDDAEKTIEEGRLLAEEAPESEVRGRTLVTTGRLALERSDWTRARELFEQASDLARKTGLPDLEKTATTMRGTALFKLGQWEEALEMYRLNLTRAEEEGDLWDLMAAYNHIAQIEYARGRFESAAGYFEKSIRIDEKLVSPQDEALARRNLGECLEMMGRWHEALDHYESCLRIPGFSEDRPSRVAVYVSLARLLGKKGDALRAMAYVQKAREAARRTRNEELLAEASFVMARLERDRDNLDRAKELLDESKRIFRETSTPQGIAKSEALAAQLALLDHDVVLGTTLSENARDLSEQLGDQITLAESLFLLGRIAYLKGDLAHGEELMERAKTIFTEHQALYHLGRVHFEFGLLVKNPEKAIAEIRKAIGIFESLGATPELERARGAIFRIRPSGSLTKGEVVGLYEIVKIINSTLSVEEVLNEVLDIVLRRLQAERGLILLIDPVSSQLRTRVARNLKDGDDAEGARSPQYIVRRVIESGQPLISADARVDERFEESETVLLENIVSTLCVPLVIRSRISGAIYVDHRETRHLFSGKDLEFLEAFADQAAIAIENARLYEELEAARLRLSAENETLRSEMLVEKHLDSIVGSSEVVRRMQFAIRKASASAATVLLRGESGTGKGLVARIIHNVSNRRGGPFIKFNCAALPENLAESELFGHEKGAFTGADRRKPGRFELADEGTIFLDEVGKMSLAMQAKLLRVVEDKEFERVGGTQTIGVNVKIIAATNLDLERAIDEGSLREDLYYRLNIIPIMLPPLRERKDDIVELTEHFVRKICRDLGVEPKRLEPGVLDLLMRHDWPGNVRELEATIHRAIVMSSGETLSSGDFQVLLRESRPDAPLPVSFDPNDLPSEVLLPMFRRLEVDEKVYAEVISNAERQLIEQALESADGKIRETARKLGIARNTLKSKLEKYGMKKSS